MPWDNNISQDNSDLNKLMGYCEKKHYTERNFHGGGIRIKKSMNYKTGVLNNGINYSVFCWMSVRICKMSA